MKYGVDLVVEEESPAFPWLQQRCIDLVNPIQAMNEHVSCTELESLRMIANEGAFSLVGFVFAVVEYVMTKGRDWLSWGATRHFHCDAAKLRVSYSGNDHHLENQLAREGLVEARCLPERAKGWPFLLSEFVSRNQHHYVALSISSTFSRTKPVSSATTLLQVFLLCSTLKEVQGG